MPNKKAELKILGEEPDLEDEKPAEKKEEEQKERKTAKENKENKQKTEKQTEELNIEILVEHLLNHEERLRAIESWIFRIKSQ